MCQKTEEREASDSSFICRCRRVKRPTRVVTSYHLCVPNTVLPRDHVLVIYKHVSIQRMRKMVRVRVCGSKPWRKILQELQQHHLRERDEEEEGKKREADSRETSGGRVFLGAVGRELLWFHAIGLTSAIGCSRLFAGCLFCCVPPSLFNSSLLGSYASLPLKAGNKTKLLYVKHMLMCLILFYYLKFNQINIYL